MRSIQRITLMTLAFLTACSSQGSSTLPTTSSTLPGHGAASVPVKFHIVVPSKSPAARRRPAYVSPSTASVTVTDISGAQQNVLSFTCTNGTCSGQMAVPVGANTFTFGLYDLFGHLLSTGSDATTIVSGQLNTVSVTFNPVVASIAMPYLSAASGQSQQINFAAKALDADGNVIVGPGSYEDTNGNPVTITAKVTDPLGGATFSKSTSTGPNDPLTLSYNGTRHDKVIIDSTNTSTLPTTNGSFVAIGAVSTYNYPGSGLVMTVGPDQALWTATSTSGGFAVIRIASDGTQTTYDVAGPNGPFGGFPVGPSGITTGPDGNLWISGGLSGLVARVTPSGTSTMFAGNGLDETYNLSVGPDGNLWTGNGITSTVAQITTAGAVTTYNTAPSSLMADPNWPGVSAFGTNGMLYYVNGSDGGIDQFSLSTHTVAATLIGNGIEATNIIEGSDGNIHFTAFVNGGASYVGSMTPGGTITTTQLPSGINFSQLVNGSDGSVWYLDPYFGLRWVDASGELGGFPFSFTTNGGAGAVCVGADGSFWVETYDAQGDAYLQHAAY